MESGLLFILCLVIAPFIAAAYFLSGRSQKVPSSTKPSQYDKKQSPPSKVSKISKDVEKESKTTSISNKKSSYSKKKKLSPPKHRRFAGWIKGHGSGIVSCAISPDGQFFAAACGDRTLRITRINDCLKIPGQPNSTVQTPLYMSTSTNFTTLTSLCRVGSNAGAIVIGVQESDRCAVFYKCKPKQKDLNSGSRSGLGQSASNAAAAAAEKTNLEEELKELTTFYSALSKKLSNDKYVTNAPKNIVESERKKKLETENAINVRKEKIRILIKMKKDTKSNDFKYEIKQLTKKSIQTNLLDTCRFIAIDQTYSGAGQQPNLVLGFSDGSTSSRNVVYSLDGKEMTAFRSKPGTSVGKVGSCFATSKDCKMVAVSLCSDAVSIHKHEASTGMSRKPVMSLAGCHNQMVTDVVLGGRACSSNHNDTDRAILCSRDGTWSLWKIDVQYKFDEEPIMLYQSEKLSTGGLTKIAISPNGKCVAVAGGTNGNELWIWSMRDAGIHDKGTIELIEKIDVGHAEGAISHLQFGPDSTYCTVAASGSKVVYLWSVSC